LICECQFTSVEYVVKTLGSQRLPVERDGFLATPKLSFGRGRQVQNMLLTNGVLELSIWQEAFGGGWIKDVTRFCCIWVSFSALILLNCVTVGYLAYKTFATYSPVVFMEQ